MIPWHVNKLPPANIWNVRKEKWCCHSLSARCVGEVLFCCQHPAVICSACFSLLCPPRKVQTKPARRNNRSNFSLKNTIPDTSSNSIQSQQSHSQGEEKQVENYKSLKTLPKAQWTRGLSSGYQRNFFRWFHKFSIKSWSYVIFIISTKQQLQPNISVSTKLKLSIA